MTIRSLMPGDMNRIREIDALCFAADDQYDDGTYAGMLDSGESIVVCVNGTVAGYAFVQRRIWQAELHVRSFAVHPAHQRKGYGKALLRRVIERSGGSVDLLVDESNEVAVRLYASLGFVPAEMCAIVPPKRRMTLVS